MGQTQQVENNLKVPIADGLDGFVINTGKVFAWANFLLIATTILQVILRYGFSNGLVVLEELEWHLYAIAFMFGMPYALITNSHVRVDVIQSRFPVKVREMIDLFGHLFLLLPFIFTVIYFGVEFTEKSWALGERSDAPLGLPFRWAIKSVIPISFSLFGLAAISRIIRSIAIIRGKTDGNR